ncbi:hypothetical protein ES703_52588 [subsurface metagenome]
MFSNYDKGGTESIFFDAQSPGNPLSEAGLSCSQGANEEQDITGQGKLADTDA